MYKRQADDQSEDADRLYELGLIELFENKDNGRKGLFVTEMGRAYYEYLVRSKRARVLDFLKWLIPLVISIAALVLAIRANTGGTVRTTNTTTRQTTQQTTTVPGNNNQQTPTNNNNNNNNNQNASSEPGGTNNAAPGGQQQNQQQNQQGNASGEASN